MLWRHRRQGREAWYAFSFLGEKSVDSWGHNITGKAFGECLHSKRWYVPAEPPRLKGEVCEY